MNARGTVACGHPDTADAACQILSDGGNAFDAALAAMCAACIAEPGLASLGGGGFLMARPAAGRHADRTLLYDFFAQTPQRRRGDDDVDFFPILADFGPTQQEFHIGMASIATPGAVRGLFAAHRDLGHMPLRRVIEPAAALARTGTRLDTMQAYVLRVISPILLSGTDSRALFTRPGEPEQLLGEGDRLLLPDMADVLEVLAIEGDDLFYRGEIARRIVADCESRGGHLTMADFADYRMERRAPLTRAAFGARFHLNPPPSAGGLLIAFALALLEGADTAGLAFGSGDHARLLTTIMDLTNRARAETRLHDRIEGDAPDVLLDPRLIDRYRRAVAMHPQIARGTTHISVVDAAGNVAALSISNGEGSGYIVPGTAIMLNNMLGEEDINPHGFHAWPTDVRLGSMMAPSVVLTRKGDHMALGSGGSNRIRTAILQVLLNLLVFQLPPEQAVTEPRLHFEGGRLSVEPGFPDAAIATAAPAGVDVHRWPERNLFFGGVHVAGREAGGGLFGVGDPRRAGVARIV